MRDAVLLAAGRGERLWPLTATRNKPLLPIANEPLVTRLARQLAGAGIERLTVVVADAGDEVAAEATRAAKAYGLALTLAEQRVRRGTGHALAQAELPEAPVLVTYGDLFLPTGELEAFVARGAGGAIGAKEVANPQDYGALELDGEALLAIHEKSGSPPSNLVNAGVYVLPEGFGPHLAGITPSPRGELELTDAVVAATTEGLGFSVHRFAGWLDVGWPWDVLDANALALAELEPAILGTVEEGATLHGPVRVEEGAVVKAGAYLEGPVLVGERATVGPNCYLRGATTIGSGAKVGAHNEIKNSVLFERSKVPHLSYVGDSVLGRDVNLGAGTIVANLRHDDANVRVGTARGVVDSGRRKLGVVLGDGVKTGINCTLNCGVMIGPGEGVAPGEVVTRTRGLSS